MGFNPKSSVVLRGLPFPWIWNEEGIKKMISQFPSCSGIETDVCMKNSKKRQRQGNGSQAEIVSVKVQVRGGSQEEPPTPLRLLKAGNRIKMNEKDWAEVTCSSSPPASAEAESPPSSNEQEKQRIEAVVLPFKMEYRLITPCGKMSLSVEQTSPLNTAVSQIIWTGPASHSWASHDIGRKPKQV